MLSDSQAIEVSRILASPTTPSPAGPPSALYRQPPSYQESVRKQQQLQQQQRLRSSGSYARDGSAISTDPSGGGVVPSYPPPQYPAYLGDSSEAGAPPPLYDSSTLEEEDEDEDASPSRVEEEEEGEGTCVDPSAGFGNDYSPNEEFEESVGDCSSGFADLAVREDGVVEKVVLEDVSELGRKIVVVEDPSLDKDAFVPRVLEVI